MVEFALVSPVLLVFLLGSFQLAWALHCAASVRWSLETNARNIMLNPSTTADQLKSAMLTQLNGIADTHNITVSLTADNSTPNAPVLRAASVYQTNLMIPFLPQQALTFNAQTEVPVP
ncbi:TadE family protein [Phenylobacterium sp.]|jgi:Flp pilus assembly protein TadG|uniref:TadE family protein n=1 Tax=Phenylobacterium sp. TaxID=1871053 RepID=UPI002E378347|nr:TadE family protein [Phenylobacterium sp.]HEX3363738.1 TadE family protein [Phenylobacterium sp.]